MTRRFIHYEEDRWAVWSTVTDDWLVTDCSEEKLIEWYADQRRQEAVEEAQDRIEVTLAGEIATFGGPSEEDVEELRRIK